MSQYSKINIPDHYNYIGVFLTLSCNLSCSYCINHTVGLKQGRKLLNANDWGIGLGRISSKNNLTLTLQGGEPTVHKDFYEIINAIPESMNIDLLTNIQFDPLEFSQKIKISKLNREAPYAPIRVSYHPETMNMEETLQKVLALKNNGFKVGVFGVLHPDQIEQIEKADTVFTEHGIDFRTKEFLGLHEGKLHGTYAYPEALFADKLKSCLCKTSELLIDPFGSVFRCHHDLYNNLNPVGHILDSDFMIVDEFKRCDYFGKCNPCDVKLKNNRLQSFGHTSVEIKFDTSDELAGIV
jgi:sulfatase maturation enzyme AslB (radical SAM superfamily)